MHTPTEEVQGLRLSSLSKLQTIKVDDMEYRLNEIVEICGGSFFGADVVVKSVMTDSRHSFGSDERPLFVAMRGLNFDGHYFIDELYKRGVRGFLVEKETDFSRYPDAGFVVVENSLRALQRIATNYRKSFKGKIVAITGSRGKTAVKEWIAQCAPNGLKVFRSPRSYNSQLGVALSLLMMSTDDDIAVIEAGISKPDEMDHLESMITPEIGIFTNLSGEHDEHFISRKHKATEKAKLFKGCKTIIFNPENKEVVDAVFDINKEVQKVEVKDNKQIIETLFSILGYDVRMSSTQLPPADMQLETLEGLGGSIIVNDNFNNDVNSLGIALDYLASVAGGRAKVLIISDILYSSLTDEKLYAKVAQIVENADTDRCICIGTRISKCREQFSSQTEFYGSVSDYLKKFSQESIEECAVLIKGGYMSQFERITHLLSLKSHTTVLEVNLDAMVHNFSYFRSKMPAGCKVMAMVKAYSYGHGDYEIAKMLERQGVNYLAVAFADEGITLRQKGVTMPIVVLNADADSFELMVANRLEPEIYSENSLNSFVRAVENGGESNYPIHIKIDSGMHRLGFTGNDVESLIGLLDGYSNSVIVRSVFSHLATSDMPEERDFTLSQIDTFDQISKTIIEKLPNKPLRHICNSAAIERFPQATMDMCRLGIGLYGVGSPELRKVSRLTTRIVQVKNLTSGDSVGYARTGQLLKDTTIATIPIGYADGLNRHLSNGKWSVIVGGKKAPIVGLICMDSCMIDVTGLEVKEGGTVVVFGGGEGNYIEDMARVLETIPYEIMTSVSQRVKRIYVKE